MSRLIDADALKTDLTRFYDNEVTAKRLIDEQPTIDAIPVEWMRDKMRGYASALKSTETSALVMVMQMWQKEQEGENND